MSLDTGRSYEVVIAATRDIGIGKDGKLPWRLASNLSFSRSIHWQKHLTESQLRRHEIFSSALCYSWLLFSNLDRECFGGEFLKTFLVTSGSTNAKIPKCMLARFNLLADVIGKIRSKPDDRHIILTAWNPSDLKLMALPRSHMFSQFYVANGELSFKCISTHEKIDLKMSL
ncbi:bifunctional dihydrofolate reductase-thymidylate synthase-like [Mercurialis annua]|uniref:bifunctional dihydrofolate reductase-thymidylate synthase-like n=1 Tax=Mercurialis annua TaxID=3986 RepID=UPI00215DF34A|nr:bifunctional dihydrofolate reductase-thymidylate synthase-like [Mercurialis annua]